jgi:hypothetical protein
MRLAMMSGIVTGRDASRRITSIPSDSCITSSSIAMSGRRVVTNASNAAVLLVS